MADMEDDHLSVNSSTARPLAEAGDEEPMNDAHSHNIQSAQKGRKMRSPENTSKTQEPSSKLSEATKTKQESKSPLKARYDKMNRCYTEDIPMTPLDQSSDDIQDESPVIPRRHTPSSDPSATLDSMATMNISIYSATSSTYTGTLKRGKKDQPVEVQLQLTQAEIDRLHRSTMSDNQDKQSSSLCNIRRGPHVLLISILFLPFAFISSLFVNLYICALCWYNIYLCLNSERTIWHAIFLCPLLVLAFPLIITMLPLCGAVYAAIRQVSWSWTRWTREIRDFEKGLYNNLCEKLGMPECSPYEVIILNENGVVNVIDENMPGTVV